jgi:hypothetical protein
MERPGKWIATPQGIDLWNISESAGWHWMLAVVAVDQTMTDGYLPDRLIHRAGLTASDIEELKSLGEMEVKDGQLYLTNYLAYNNSKAERLKYSQSQRDKAIKMHQQKEAKQDGGSVPTNQFGPPKAPAALQSVPQSLPPVSPAALDLTKWLDEADLVSAAEGWTYEYTDAVNIFTQANKPTLSDGPELIQKLRKAAA